MSVGEIQHKRGPVVKMTLFVRQVLQDVHELLKVQGLAAFPYDLKPPPVPNHLAEAVLARNHRLQQLLALCHVAKDVLDTTPGGMRAIAKLITELRQPG